MRQLAGEEVIPRDLQEAEAHQIRAERNAEVDEPARYLEVRRYLVGIVKPVDELRAHGADHGGEEGAAQQTEQHDRILPRRLDLIDHDVNADMDAGAHAIGGAELGDPDEHVDAK